ncbi:MAG: DoxX family membrane protein [bacterium]|nr:DoxX family membrane protein [bacterium]
MIQDKQGRAAQTILRVGVAFTFIYAAVAGFIDPESWIGWFPESAQNMLPAETLLLIWGIIEITLGLWILSGKNIFWPSLVASLSLAGLILTNLGAMDIIFRDITILAATIALAIQNFPKKQPV